jgi:hypothetical protein
MSRLPDAQGWLRKDATAKELRVEVDRILGGRSSARSFGSASSIAAAIVVLVIIAAVLIAALLRP